MLFEFIVANRERLIARARIKVAKRLAPQVTANELESGVPLFLDQLVAKLSHKTSDESSARLMTLAATNHGAVLLSLNYTVAQVVRDYGDVCQSITELASELNADISVADFHELNLALDNAIAEAVTEYMRLRDATMAFDENQRSGVLAHELRNRITSAKLAFEAIKNGSAPVNGGVAAVLTRSLHGLTTLISRALVEVRLEAGNIVPQRVHLRHIIEELEVDGAMEAAHHGVSLLVRPMSKGIDIQADRQILYGAVSNLLQNAFKFTNLGGLISVTTKVTDSIVTVEVEDQCGGLPPGKTEQLFEAFKQRGADRSGLGLGLFITRRGIEASGGKLKVRDIPGKGCVFAIELPMVA